MKRKNYTISEISEKQLAELKIKIGVTHSELVRRAIELYWETKINK